MTFDGKAFGEAIAAKVKAALDQAINAFDQRLRAIEARPAPKDGQDGVGVAGAVIDRDGQLVLTLSNGTTCKLGVVAAKDGERGDPGFGLDDFEAELQPDGRTLQMRFVRGEAVESHELKFPVMIYRGVFKEGQTYERGDTVTWAGSLWHCDEPTADRPEGEAKAWTLAAKRGRDGKAA